MVFTHLSCGVYSGFVQQRIQDASVELFTAFYSTVGFSFIHSIVQQSLLLAIHSKLFFVVVVVSRGCGYVQSNHSSGLPYDKIVVTIVEHDT